MGRVYFLVRQEECLCRKSRLFWRLRFWLFLRWRRPSKRPQLRDALTNQIAGELSFLSSDVLQGRGSGTNDELLAATYISSELRQIGLTPAGDKGDYIQDVTGTFKFRGGPKEWHTRNVIGVLPGGDPKLKDQVVLLTAHLDHVGTGDGGEWRLYL